MEICNILRKSSTFLGNLQHLSTVINVLRKYKEICNVLRKSARFEDIVRRRHNRSLITKLHLLRVCNPLARSAGVFFKKSAEIWNNLEHSGTFIHVLRRFKKICGNHQVFKEIWDTHQRFKAF